jgi:polysaccharide pyruvyl transferase WcaK-like protein
MYTHTSSVISHNQSIPDSPQQYFEGILPSLPLSPYQKLAANPKPIWHFAITGTSQSPMPPPNKGDYSIYMSIQKELQNRLVGHQEFKMFSAKFDLLTPEMIEDLNATASALLIGGGGLFSHRQTESSWYFRCSPDDFEKIEVPIILAGVGLNQSLFESPLTISNENILHSISSIISKAALVSVRDLATLELIKSCQGSNLQNVSVVCDPAFLLLERQPEVIKDSIAVDLSFHEPYLRQCFPSILDEMVHFLRWLQTNSDLKIKFISHDPSERFIVPMLVERGIVIEEVLDTYDIQQWEGFYSSLQYVISQKMHPAILAASVGVPSITINYDLKQKFLPGISEGLIQGIDMINFTSDILIEKIARLNSEQSCMQSNIERMRTSLPFLNANVFFDRAALMIATYQA